MKILLYSVAAVLCGLLLVCEARVKKVEIEVIQGGVPVTDASISAKLNEKIYINCLYDVLAHPSQVTSVRFQGPTDAAMTVIFVSGHMSEPWNIYPKRYNYTINWDNEPYSATFKMSEVMLVDEGEYICSVDATGKDTIYSSGISISVYANVDRVVLDREGDLYKVEDDGLSKTIICTAYNGSEPTINIVIDNRILVPTGVVKVEGEEEYVGTGTFIFTEELHGKSISCEALVKGFEEDITADSTTLQVITKPKVECDEKVEARVGGKTKLTCTVIGNPLPEISSLEWRLPAALPVRTLAGNDENAQLSLKSMAVVGDDQINAELQMTILDERYFDEYVLAATVEGRYGSGAGRIVKQSETVKDDNSGSSPLSVLSSLVILIGSYVLLM